MNMELLRSVKPQGSDDGPTKGVPKDYYSRQAFTIVE